MSSRPSRRIFAFAAVCIACVLVVGAYAVNSLRRQNQSAAEVAGDAAASPQTLASITARPHLLFLHSPMGDTYRRVAIVPLDAPDEQRYLTPLQCQRVYFRAGQGLCLGRNSIDGVASSYNSYSFDAQFDVHNTYAAAGLPTRVRLSRDGRLGAMTVFVMGHSYADAAYSTQTQLVDTGSGRVVTDLEKFPIERAGAPFEAVDFNFWGVTFERDADHFYATLGSGGRTYLLLGELSTMRAKVIAENAECPSLSPDDTRIVFKKRVSNSSRVWQLTQLDLTSMTESPVPGETRSIDDQVEWLDDNHILYGAQEQGSLATDIWVASLDGSEQPRIFVHQALSPAVVR